LEVAGANLQQINVPGDFAFPWPFAAKRFKVYASVAVFDAACGRIAEVLRINPEADARILRAGSKRIAS